MSFRAFSRSGLVLLPFGMSCLELAALVLDHLTCGSAVSLRASARFDLLISVYGMARLGFFLSALDFAHPGLALLLEESLSHWSDDFGLWHRTHRTFDVGPGSRELRILPVVTCLDAG